MLSSCFNIINKIKNNNDLKNIYIYIYMAALTITMRIIMILNLANRYHHHYCHPN